MSILVLLVALLALVLARVSGNQNIASSGCNLLAYGLTFKSYSPDIQLPIENFNLVLFRMLGLCCLRLVKGLPGSVNPFNNSPYDQKICWLGLIESKSQDLVLKLSSLRTGIGAFDLSQVPRRKPPLNFSKPALFSGDLMEYLAPGYFLLM